jgi:glycosyltransferase involved in cell wall biosynthesis
MVACFKPQKSPLDFIEVARHVLDVRKDVHFVMAGDGELRPEIEARIHRYKLEDHVTLLGWQRNMPGVYQNLDIFLLTSLWEGQPCVYAEAMASGLPIVATDVDGAQEAILDGTTGFIHAPRPAFRDGPRRLVTGRRIRHRPIGRDARALLSRAPRSVCPEQLNV